MSRKTRRDLVWALAAALCGGLVPACTHSMADVAPAGPRITPARPAAVNDESPYVRLPPVAPRQDGPAPPPKPGAALVSRDSLPLILPPDPTPAAEAVPNPGQHAATLAKHAAETPPDKPAAAVPLPLVDVKPPAEAAQPPLVEALRCFLDNRPAEALASLKAYDKDNQELLLLLLPLAARLTEGSVHKANAQEVAFFMEQLNGVEVALRPRASLVIDKMCFCKEIRAFGVYEPTADKPAYRTGDWPMVYIEVRNFSSTKRAGAQGQTFYVTSLTTSAQILDGRNKKVWPSGPGPFVLTRGGPDKSRTLRHDYFDRCEFQVPELAPGSYTLWIQVQDVATGRTARGSLDFDVSYGGL